LFDIDERLSRLIDDQNYSPTKREATMTPSTFDVIRESFSLIVSIFAENVKILSASLNHSSIKKNNI
jgi:hypothetical protein